MDGIVGAPVLEAMATMSRHGWWVATWRGIAFLGEASFFVVLLPVVWGALPWRIALRFSAAVLVSALLTEALKHGFDRPRYDPLLFGLVAPLETTGALENSAFPSGHTLMAVVIWGWVALRRPFKGSGWILGLLVGLIAGSRLALLRHDLLDVAGGLVFGGLGLGALTLTERFWPPSPGRLAWPLQAGLWTAAAALAHRVVDLPATAIVAGVLAGLGGGAAFARTRRARPADLTWRGARVALGLAGVAVIRAGADGVQSPWALFGIYALAGWWVAALVPALLRGPLEDPLRR